MQDTHLGSFSLCRNAVGILQPKLTEPGEKYYSPTNVSNLNQFVVGKTESHIIIIIIRRTPYVRQGTAEGIFIVGTRHWAGAQSRPIV